MTAINSNRAIRGPVTAVPVVAGKGVRLVADTENNRWVVEADETVLWEDATGALDSISLSESLTNFERIKIVWKDWSSFDCINVQEFDSTSSNFTLTGTWAGTSTSIIIFSIAMTPNASKTTLTNRFARFITSNNISTVSDANNTRILKVIGINRIASN